jgi:hypothetical protein
MLVSTFCPLLPSLSAWHTLTVTPPLLPTLVSYPRCSNGSHGTGYPSVAVYPWCSNGSHDTGHPSVAVYPWCSNGSHETGHPSSRLPPVLQRESRSRAPF